MLKCCIPNCTAIGTSKHRFPNPKTHPELFFKWIDMLGLDELKNMEPREVYARKLICLAHFDVKQEKLENPPKLPKLAVPSLNLPNDDIVLPSCNRELLNGKEDEFVKNILWDHSYLGGLTTEQNSEMYLNENVIISNGSTLNDVKNEVTCVMKNKENNVDISNTVSWENNSDVISPIYHIESNSELTKIEESSDISCSTKDIKPVDIKNDTKIINKTRVMYNTTCSVPHCKNYRKESISVHKFPSDPTLCKKWALALEIKKPIKEYMKICSDHFKETDFFPCRVSSKPRKILKKNAVPFLKKYDQGIKRTCFAKNCSNDSERQKNLSFFPFPNTKKLGRIWTINANSDELHKQTNLSLPRFLCALHFEDKYFVDPYTKRKLKQDTVVIPTIFNENVKNASTDLFLVEDIQIEKTPNEVANESEDISNTNNIIEMNLNEVTITNNMTESCNTEFGQINYSDSMSNNFEIKSENILSKLDLKVNQYYCRLCAELFQLDSLEPIFENGAFTTLGKMLDVCLPGKYTIDDNLPKTMCFNCATKLENCYKAIQQFLDAEIELYNIIYNKSVPVAEENSETVPEQQLYVVKSIVNDENNVEKIEVTVNPAASIPVDINELMNENKEEESNNKYQCLICVQKYNNKQDLIDHFLIAHPEKAAKNKIVCTVVPADSNKPKTSTPEKIKTNINNRASKIMYECVICSSFHEKKSTLVKHTLRYHSEENKGKIVCRILKLNRGKILKCLHCKNIFRNFRKYKKHVQGHFELNCVECGLAFNTVYQLKEHIKVHKEKPYTCLECNRFFTTKSALTNHAAAHKNIIKNAPSESDGNDVELHEPKEISKKALCQICGKLFSAMSLLNYHLQQHSDDRPFKCSVCSKSFKTTISLQQHKRIHSSEKNYICQTCGKRFRYLGVLKSHIISHSNYKPHSCGLCGARFNRKGNLKTHMKIHIDLNDKCYKCRICKIEFESRYLYMVHKRMHADEKKPFSCEVCEKKFSTKFQVQIHLRIHTGETPFTCEICNKSFRSSAIKKQHKLIHMDVFPHHCEFCDRKFRRLQSLIVHRRTHTGERPFPCPTCGRPFANRGDMIKHKRIHMRKDKKVISIQIDTEAIETWQINDMKDMDLILVNDNSIHDNKIVEDFVIEESIVCEENTSPDNNILSSILLS